MNDKDDHAKLDALVGAALKGLVEAGASTEAIGSFAASYRREAAGILGLAEAPPEAPDLQDLVTTAVSQALEEAGVLRNGRSHRSKAGDSAKSMRHLYVTIEGKRTSITVRPEDIQRAAAKLGGEGPAKQFIEQLAQTAPPRVQNRSLWVREHLHLALAQKDEQISHATH